MRNSLKKEVSFEANVKENSNVRIPRCGKPTFILIQMVGASTSPVSFPSCANVRDRLPLEKLILVYGEEKKELSMKGSHISCL